MSICHGDPPLAYPVPHHAHIAKSGDGRYAPCGWRVRCCVCRSWWTATLDDWPLCVKVADRHVNTGTWS